jgi:hypothetical protein
MSTPEHLPEHLREPASVAGSTFPSAVHLTTGSGAHVAHILELLWFLLRTVSRELRILLHRSIVGCG